MGSRCTSGVPRRRGRRTDLKRGAIHDVGLREGHRPVVIVTRDRAIPVLANVVVAVITRTVRGLPTEVQLGPEHGVDAGCVINCDNLVTVAKRDLGRRRGELDPPNCSDYGPLC